MSTGSDFLASLQKTTVKSTTQQKQKRRANASAADVSTLLEAALKPRQEIKPVGKKAVADVRQSADAVTASFLPVTDTNQGKSTQQKPKEVVDAGITALIQKALDEASEAKLTERLDYLEKYWDELEADFERREKAIEWMKKLPAGREGIVAFLNGMTEEHCKAFILSMTIYSPLKYTVHWFDDTKTDVEMDSNIEDYRNTASYYDGHVMRDGSQRKRYVKRTGVSRHAK